MMSEIANLEGQQQLPHKLFSSLNVQTFCRALKDQMLDEQSGFGKAYLKLLVNENGLWKKAAIRGGDGAQSNALEGKSGTHKLACPVLGIPGSPLYVDAYRKLLLTPTPEMHSLFNIVGNLT
jgi:hypothetical protein